MTDSSARHYMEYAYREIEQGGCPASFAGKAVAHVFDDSSDDLRRDVLAMIKAVDTYLETYDVPEGVYHYPDVTCAEVIRFWRYTERAYYMQSKHAQVNA